MEVLILVAESNIGPTMMARIGVMNALNRHRVRSSRQAAKRRIGGSGIQIGINRELARRH
jgi:hypothetical protein